MPRPFIVAIAAAVTLAACATAPTYTPAAALGGAGYSETQVESNRYFVTYRSASPANVQMLQDFALLRAAELTLQNGRDWFWVDRRSVDEEAQRSSGPTIGVGIGAGNWGRHTGVNVGVGMNFPIGGATGPKARAATVEIRMGEGVKPDDPNTYDAHAIAANIRARLAP